MKLKSMIILISIIFLISSVSAFEWHSGTWVAPLSADGYPVSNLAITPDGGTWIGKLPQASSLCYDMTNTSLDLKDIIIEYVDNDPAKGFYAGIGDSCYNTVHNSATFTGDQSNLEIPMTFGSGHRYVIFRQTNVGGGYAMTYRNIKLYFNVIPDKEVDFVATPLNGPAPHKAYFTALNLSNTNNVSWSYGEGQTYTANLANTTFTYNNPGTYTVSMEYTNNSGIRKTVTKVNYIQVNPQGNISLLVDIIDAITGDLIQNSQVGIQNTTSGIWRNSTAAGGTPIFQSTGANYEFPLRIGQTVVVAGGAFGYDNQSANITIPYNNYEHALHLMPLNKAASNGTWNVVVLIKSNKYGKPINSATVQVTTGVNGQGIYEGLTHDAGTVTFTNVSASTTAMIRAVAQGYQDTSIVVPVFVNTTQHVTIEMVGLDDTPVATPIPTSNKTPLTGQPTPQITDENGDPITTSEGKAQWGLDQLFNLIPTIALIVASLIIAWLFWRGIDICTNGMATLIMRKVIEGFIRQMFK